MLVTRHICILDTVFFLAPFSWYSIDPDGRGLDWWHGLHEVSALVITEIEDLFYQLLLAINTPSCEVHTNTINPNNLTNLITPQLTFLELQLVIYTYWYVYVLTLQLKQAIETMLINSYIIMHEHWFWFLLIWMFQNCLDHFDATLRCLRMELL